MKKFIENSITGILLGGFVVVFMEVVYRTIRWILGL